jgi:hypothetical protein
MQTELLLLPPYWEKCARVPQYLLFYRPYRPSCQCFPPCAWQRQRQQQQQYPMAATWQS